MSDDRAAHFVQSLERGLAVIRAFGADTPSLTLSEVARSTGLTRAATRRFLLTLGDLGYVRSDGRRFELTPRVLELGYAFLSSIDLPEVSEPHLERLVAEVHESSSVSVLDGDDIVYVARVPTRRIMNVGITIGTRFPAHATSMGRVLLAALPDHELEPLLRTLHAEHRTDRTVTDPAALRTILEEVREQGWALVDQELEIGLRSIAAPVHARDGRVTAAVNVSGAAATSSIERLRDEYLPALLRTAAQIDEALRHSGAMAAVR